eukprot:gene1441-12060_t
MSLLPIFYLISTILLCIYMLHRYRMLPQFELKSVNSLVLLRNISNSKDSISWIYLPNYINFLLLFPPLKWMSFYLYKENYPGNYEFHEGLLKYFDRLFLKILQEKIEQIVIIGSKFDTRTIRFHKIIKDIEVFELEKEDILKQKTDCLKSNNLISTNVKYISMSNLKEIEKKLNENNFQKKNTIWMIENQISYLKNEQEMIRLFSLISSMSQKFFILFDFVDEKFFNAPDEYVNEGSFEFVQLMKSRNERLGFGIDSSNLNQFLNEKYKIYDYKNGKDLGTNVPSYFSACCLTNK